MPMSSMRYLFIYLVHVPHSGRYIKQHSFGLRSLCLGIPRVTFTENEISYESQNPEETKNFWAPKIARDQLQPRKMKNSLAAT